MDTQVHQLFHSTYRGDTTVQDVRSMKIREAVTDLRKLLPARSVVCPLSTLTDAYQHQPIGVVMLPDVLHDISIRHPWTHNTKWKEGLRNLNDRKYVWMGNLFAPFDFMVKSLCVECVEFDPD